MTLTEAVAVVVTRSGVGTGDVPSAWAQTELLIQCRNLYSEIAHRSSETAACLAVPTVANLNAGVSQITLDALLVTNVNWTVQPLSGVSVLKSMRALRLTDMHSTNGAMHTDGINLNYGFLYDGKFLWVDPTPKQAITVIFHVIYPYIAPTASQKLLARCDSSGTPTRTELSVLDQYDDIAIYRTAALMKTAAGQDPGLLADYAEKREKFLLKYPETQTQSATRITNKDA